MTDKEINEAVARKLGWEINSDYHQYRKGDEHKKIIVPSEVPHYCTDIAAAWEIVEKMRFCIWRYKNQYQCGIEGDIPEHYGSHDSAPMAICLAFLKVP